MRRKIILAVFLVVLTSLAIWALLQYPRVPKGYVRYVPPEGSDLLLQFIYPDTWQVTEDAVFGLRLVDPERVASSLNYGIIYIGRGVPPDQNTPQKALAWEQQLADFVEWKTILLSEELLVAGVPAAHVVARVLPRTILSPEGEVPNTTVITIDEKYYLYPPGANNYFDYNIQLTIPEDERNGAFGQGFDMLIYSLTIINQSETR